MPILRAEYYALSVGNMVVDEVQSRIAAVFDSNPDTSAISSGDYSLRLAFMNMALTEWQEAYDWQVLYKEYNVLVSTSTGNASIALPSDFRKLASFPVIANGTDSTGLYGENRPQESGQYESTDKRVEILGNPASNYTLRVYGTTLASGASIKVPYYSSAGSLATSISMIPCPNPDYIVKRTLAYLFEANEDARLPQAKLDAERILGSLIDYENTFGEASQSDRVKTVDETRHNFRMGE